MRRGFKGAHILLVKLMKEDQRKEMSNRWYEDRQDKNCKSIRISGFGDPIKQDEVV